MSNIRSCDIFLPKSYNAFVPPPHSAPTPAWDAVYRGPNYDALRRETTWSIRAEIERQREEAIRRGAVYGSSGTPERLVSYLPLRRGIAPILRASSTATNEASALFIERAASQQADLMIRASERLDSRKAATPTVNRLLQIHRPKQVHASSTLSKDSPSAVTDTDVLSPEPLPF
jgi:hypothetical protein